ncbi:MAG TPA: transcriptional regulator [Xanthomonadaceae bacterium]|nr:transcriptional regulator [Xanthomonadaceae bacterium]
MPPKSIHKSEYQTLLQHLRAMRLSAQLTQTDLSVRLQRPQSYVSDVERGSRRLDLLQLREYCHACGQGLTDFVRKLEGELSEP